VGDRELPRAEDRLAPDRRLSLRAVERPAAGDPVGALVFFHGYYGVGTDFLGLLEKLDPERRLHGYLPHGPLPMGEGRSRWFDHARPEAFDDELAVIAGWVDSLPFASDRLVLGGWSQGAAVAYAVALLEGRPRPAALLALGGRMPERVAAQAFAPPLPRVAIAHGAADDSIPVEEAREARRLLEAAGADVLYLETAIGHELDQAVIPDLRAFVREVGG
jgi:phospholipase/carboxylesterase